MIKKLSTKNLTLIYEDKDRSKRGMMSQFYYLSNILNNFIQRFVLSCYNLLKRFCICLDIELHENRIKHRIMIEE